MESVRKKTKRAEINKRFICALKKWHLFDADTVDTGQNPEANEMIVAGKDISDERLSPAVMAQTRYHKVKDILSDSELA